MRILITDSLSKEGIRKLSEEGGFQVKQALGLNEEELIKIIPEYEVLIVRSETRVTEKVIRAANKLKVIGRAGTGVDNIDVEAATKKGIIVMNTPGGNTISAAEHTISLILALSRNIPQAHASLREGKWERKKFMGSEVYGKTLGIIGLGRIGSEVAKRAQGLKMKVVAYDPFVSRERAEKLGVTLLELKKLLTQVDYLTIHTPLTERTRNLIGKTEFSLMKKEVRIVNCARGGIIDEEALYEALKTERIKGAALDVFEKGKPFDSPLLKLDSVILTPHLGASTQEAQKRVAIDIASQIIDFFKGGMIRNAVNVSMISPEAQKRLKPYLCLAEKIGELEAQLIEGHPKELEIIYAGELVNLEIAFLTAKVIRGFLKSFLREGEIINYVNALLLAKERGIKVVEVKNPEVEGFNGLISVKLTTDIQEKKIEGTVFGKEISRIVGINGYPLDFLPRGNFLISSNVDKPGVVGKIGTILGKFGVNIGGLQMGRKTRGSKNVSVYILDSFPPRQAIEELLKMEEILDARVVRL
ncbi:phosphoglycerate dehydrogenase [Candidatus Aerophobetes bacterium]|nr:phosphoglycerate dehydrogenase [Candidatus Aerophobetes bacterium]